MVGSPVAEADARNDPAGRRRRFLHAASASLALALLGACSAAPPSASLLPPAPIAAQPTTVQFFDMRQLQGLSAADLVARFGEPDFRRAEPPAELWQYRGADCILDLFLYDQAGSERVVYGEARDRSLVRAGIGQCAGGGDAVIRGSRQTRL